MKSVPPKTLPQRKRERERNFTSITINLRQNPRDSLLLWAIEEGDLNPPSRVVKDIFFAYALSRAKRYVMFKHGLDESEFEFMPLSTLLSYLHGTTGAIGATGATGATEKSLNRKKASESEVATTAKAKAKAKATVTATATATAKNVVKDDTCDIDIHEF